jgi:hypothetical protein
VTRVTRSRAQGDRLPGNGQVGPVLTPADSRVNRSRGSEDLASRQETIVTGSPGPGNGRAAGKPGQNVVSGQAIMRQAAPGQSDLAHEEAMFENLFNQVKPGALQRSHVSGQRSERNVDSGPSMEQSRGVQPGQAASPGGQPARVGTAQDRSDRSASRESPDVDNLAVQALGRDQVAGASQDLAGTGPGGSEQVSQTVIRRSGRNRTKLNPYQAGSSGME